jgi:hypothetical protein
MSAPLSRVLHRRDERGVSLLLALGFIFSIGLVILGISTFAANAFKTTVNLDQQRAREANAESAVTLAISNVRFNYNAFTSASPNCMPSTPANAWVYPTAIPTQSGAMTVFCTYSDQNVGSAASRVVNFMACPVSVSSTAAPSSSCAQASAALYAQVTFDDLPPNASPLANTCTATGSGTTCGVAMTVDTWDVRSADN